MSVKGNTETREALVGNIHLLKKIPGYSAYEIAVKHGFKGTEAEWLISISAYGIAVKLGFEGTVEEWIASLKGEKGDIGNVEFHGGIDALGERIKNVADPVEDGDAVNKKYIDEAAKHLVTIGSHLDANNMTVKNVADPTAVHDAVNKKYFDEAVAESRKYVDETFTKDTVEHIDKFDFLELAIKYPGDAPNFLFDSFYDSIAKYGKCIQGHLMPIPLAENYVDNALLFTIKEPYRPATDVLITFFTENEGEGTEAVITLRIEASTGECRVFGQPLSGLSVVTGDFKFSFMYICK